MTAVSLSKPLLDLIKQDCPNFKPDRLQEHASHYNGSFAKILGKPNFEGLQSLIDRFIEPLSTRYNFSGAKTEDSIDCYRPEVIATSLDKGYRDFKLRFTLAGAAVPPPEDYNVALSIQALPFHVLRCSLAKDCYETTCKTQECKATQSLPYDPANGSSTPIANLPSGDSATQADASTQPQGSAPDASSASSSGSTTQTGPNPSGSASSTSSGSTPNVSSSSMFAYLPKASTAIPACATLLCLFKAAQAARAWHKLKHEAVSSSASLPKKEEKAGQRALAYSALAVAGLAVTIMQARS